ncbi:MAG: hypothetical protein QHI38_04270 [Armatimonadota bacterium]|nr:hypothetical protein [Armatimonadota bacterium]
MILVREACISGILAALAIASPCAAASITIRNNYDVPYAGAVTLGCSLPDGIFESNRGYARVRGGAVLASVDIPPHSEVKLVRTSQSARKKSGPISVSSVGSTLRVRYGNASVADVDFALVVVPGRRMTASEVPSAFKAIPLQFAVQNDGSISASAEVCGYFISIRAVPCPEAGLDFFADVKRTQAPDGPAYVALVRRINTPVALNHRIRWNGRVVDSDTEPNEFNIDFRLTRGLDWASWNAGRARVAVINGFAPGISIEQRPGTWITANRFYVWEYLRRRGNSHYFVSEIAGRDPEQPESYRGVKSYTQPRRDEPIKLKWRLAVAESPYADWEESQLLVFAGYRKVSVTGEDVTVDLGVSHVEFGTSYFPYSTMCENFDYYRTPGLDREGWWPFSSQAWENWRAFEPQMRTDLRIIKSMGFEWVRLHHLELVGTMNRDNALQFLDFFMNECRTLGLKVLVDTAGSPGWFSTIAGRYRDVVKLIEIENEVLIPGIKPGAPERWKACYQAAKSAAPDTEVFLTGNCNMAMFHRLVSLGVPFDRTGYHSYKHGPGWEETFKTLPVAVAGCAVDLGTTPVLGEFNWKELTRWSPEARAERFETIYRNVLSQRAVKEFFQFHWQETLCVNPRLTRKGIRHYETIYLDRRPKPEAYVLMRLIREYCRLDSPQRELPISIEEVALHDGKACARITVQNNMVKRVTVRLTSESYSELRCGMLESKVLELAPGEMGTARVELSLPDGALPGVYHYFVKAEYEGKVAYGWGWAINRGEPTFSPDPVLGDLVEYGQNPAEKGTIDWGKLVCVAFGPEASVVEVEMAYLIFNTLQSATGMKLRLCSTADIPSSLLASGSLILVGTPSSNPLIHSILSKVDSEKGRVEVDNLDGGRQWLLITGKDERSVQAAATDFVLRYWRNAKDAACRITGLEKGAALGNRAAPGEVNPP